MYFFLRVYAETCALGGYTTVYDPIPCVYVCMCICVCMEGRTKKNDGIYKDKEMKGVTSRCLHVSSSRGSLNICTYMYTRVSASDFSLHIKVFRISTFENRFCM